MRSNDIADDACVVDISSADLFEVPQIVDPCGGDNVPSERQMMTGFDERMNVFPYAATESVDIAANTPNILPVAASSRAKLVIGKENRT